MMDITNNANFQEWFGDSQVVDQNGAPLVVYHGTARGDRVGNRFLKSRATSGPMAYFTDSIVIATSYSTKKSDTSLEWPESYIDWFRLKLGRRRVNLRQAWNILSTRQQQEVIARLPHVGMTEEDLIGLGGEPLTGQDHVQYVLKREAGGNGLVAACELWLSSGALFNQEARFLEVLTALGLPVGDNGFQLNDPNATFPKVYACYLAIENPLDATNLPEDVFTSLVRAARKARQPKYAGGLGVDQWDKNQWIPMKWIEQLQHDLEHDTTHVWTSIPDWVTRTLIRLGYDGIRDVGGKRGGQDHTVWIPFEPWQVKSAVDNRGTFSRKSHSIKNPGRGG